MPSTSSMPTAPSSPASTSTTRNVSVATANRSGARRPASFAGPARRRRRSEPPQSCSPRRRASAPICAVSGTNSATRATASNGAGGPRERFTARLSRAAGANQLLNASGALAAFDVLRTSACRSARRPCARGSRGRAARPFPGARRAADVVLDVAHNPHAVAALAENLDQMGFFPRTHAVFGMLGDKDIDAVLARMAPRVDAWHFTDAADRARSDGGPLGGAARRRSTSAGHPVSSQHARVPRRRSPPPRRADPADRIVVFGSFYNVGAVLASRACPTSRSPLHLRAPAFRPAAASSPSHSARTPGRRCSSRRAIPPAADARSAGRRRATGAHTRQAAPDRRGRPARRSASSAFRSFETQPRPIPVDIPIEIPRRKALPPLLACRRPAAPSASGRSEHHRRRRAAPKDEAAPYRAATGTSRSAVERRLPRRCRPRHDGRRIERPVAPPRRLLRGPGPAVAALRGRGGERADAHGRGDPSRRVGRAAPQAASQATGADVRRGERARALLEGRPVAAAATVAVGSSCRSAPSPMPRPRARRAAGSKSWA